MMIIKLMFLSGVTDRCLKITEYGEFCVSKYEGEQTEVSGEIVKSKEAGEYFQCSGCSVELLAPFGGG